MHPEVEALALKHAAEMSALHIRLMQQAISEKPAASQPSGKRGRGRPADPNSKSGRVRDYLARRPWSPVADIQAETGIERRALTHLLTVLRKRGHVQARGEAGSYVYAVALKAVA